MSIKINHIEVESLGPLSAFSGDLADVTLIYGHNEKGKTFLVEFILKSLFKNLGGFKNELRIGKSKGKIVVSGLEGEPITFSPNSKNKLDTFWEENDQGMPPNIARLMVVRGGDTHIDKESDDGISRDVIREFLSGQRILDSIQKRIRLKGTRAATIEAGEIIGANSGDIGKRNEVLSEINSIEQLLDRVNLELSDGDIVALGRKVTQVEEISKMLEVAKKYAAYLLSQSKQKVDKDIKKFDDAQFPAVDKIFSDYLQKKEFIATKKEKKDEAAQRGEYYPWLNNAIEQYQQSLVRTTASIRPVFAILSIVFLIISIVLIIIQQTIPAIAGAFLSIVSMILYYFQVKRYQTNRASSSEIEQIRTTYAEKFNEPCKDLPTMRVKKDTIEVDYHAALQIEKDIQQAQTELTALENEIQQGLKALGLGKTSSDQWNKTFPKLRDTLTSLNAQSQELKTNLARYDVDPSDFVEVDPGVIYKREELDAARKEKESLEQEKLGLDQSLVNLRSEIQAVIKDHSLTDWGELIHNLRELKLKKTDEYKQITADILAGKLLSDAIEQARQQEDENVSESLNSEAVTTLVKQITKHYTSFELESNSLKVLDDINQTFDFSELSTGSREQILLALRIGFAKKILQGDTAFLIFDDAFQHSDWERRSGLVDTAFDLAKQGWQVIYFSMDDNIRDLFDERGARTSKETYVRIDL